MKTSNDVPYRKSFWELKHGVHYRICLLQAALVIPRDYCTTQPGRLQLLDWY